MADKAFKLKGVQNLEKWNPAQFRLRIVALIAQGFGSSELRDTLGWKLLGAILDSQCSYNKHPTAP